MSQSTLPDTKFSIKSRRAVLPQPGGVQAACLQEQFTGALPERNERPAAELFKERQAESIPSGFGPLFVP